MIRASNFILKAVRPLILRFTAASGDGAFGGDQILNWHSGLWTFTKTCFLSGSLASGLPPELFLNNPYAWSLNFFVKTLALFRPKSSQTRWPLWAKTFANSFTQSLSDSFRSWLDSLAVNVFDTRTFSLAKVFCSFFVRSWLNGLTGRPDSFGIVFQQSYAAHWHSTITNTGSTASFSPLLATMLVSITSRLDPISSGVVFHHFFRQIGSSATLFHTASLWAIFWLFISDHVAK